MDRLKVLLVDDEKVFIENIARLLEKREYQATALYNGEDAINALKQKEFDVMVLDLKMPGLDGIATMKEIKNLSTPPEVLMLTGHGSLDTALEAVKLGAYDYLAKPCELEELIEKIEEIARRRKNNRKKTGISRYRKG
jgi:DNA-binding NtrC family response regulator